MVDFDKGGCAGPGSFPQRDPTESRLLSVSADWVDGTLLLAGAASSDG